MKDLYVLFRKKGVIEEEHCFYSTPGVERFENKVEGADTLDLTAYSVIHIVADEHMGRNHVEEKLARVANTRCIIILLTPGGKEIIVPEGMGTEKARFFKSASLLEKEKYEKECEAAKAGRAALLKKLLPLIDRKWFSLTPTTWGQEDVKVELSLLLPFEKIDGRDALVARVSSEEELEKKVGQFESFREQIMKVAEEMGASRKARLFIGERHFLGRLGEGKVFAPENRYEWDVIMYAGEGSRKFKILYP